MNFPIFNLDVIFSPVDEFFFMMEEGGWIIALVLGIIIGATVGMLIYRKKKGGKK